MVHGAHYVVQQCWCCASSVHRIAVAWIRFVSVTCLTLYLARNEHTICVRLILVVVLLLYYLTPRCWWRSKSVGRLVATTEKLSRNSFQLEDWSPSIWSITMTKSCQCHGVSWSHLAYRFQYFWEVIIQVFLFKLSLPIIHKSRIVFKKVFSGMENKNILIENLNFFSKVTSFSTR